MGFNDLKADSGVKTLNEYLADKSYVEGFQPSQADVAVFEALSGSPKAEFVHALRWYKHVNSWGNERTSFPGEKKSVDSYGPVSAAAASTEKKDDDDFDLFGDDEEDDEEAERIKEERLAMYADKKAKKTQIIAKSNIILEVKPWDDETDMAELEKCVRSVETDGLLWGASKLVPIAYGLKKLQISCVVVDDKVGTDFLEESIGSHEDYIQSVDIVAFNKV